MLLTAACMLAACAAPTSQQADPPSRPATAVPTVTAGAPASPEPDPAESTEAVTPSPAPTAVPRQRSVFERIEMSVEMAGTPEHSFTRAHSPAGDFGWLGAGHRYDPTIGISTPGTWLIDGFDDRTSVTFEPLPVPTGALGGNAYDTAVIGPTEVVLGRTIEPGGVVSLALWSRTVPDADWTFADGEELGIPRSELSDSAGWQIRGSEDWGLLLAGSAPFTSEPSLHREIKQQRHLFRSVNGRTWQPVDLGLDDMTQWSIATHLHGLEGLVIATWDREGASNSTSATPEPVVRTFTTRDGGETWTPGRVIIEDDRAVQLRAALWADDEWLLAGSVGTVGEREPAIWERNENPTEEPTWSRVPVELDLADVFADRDLQFAALHQRSDGRYVAVLDLNHGSRTLLSADRLSWSDSEFHWLNRIDDDTRANLSSLVPDPSGERFLALRGFDSPVRLDKNGSTIIHTDGAFEAERRWIESLDYYGGTFAAMVVDAWNQDPQRARLWHSPAGAEWRGMSTVRDRLLVDATSVGAKLFTLVEVLEDGATTYTEVRNYDAQGRGRTASMLDLLPEGTERAQIFESAPARGRPLFASSTEGQTVMAFADPDDADTATVYIVPDAGLPSAVCPELASGEFAVAIQRPDGGTWIEIWIDQESPRIASGPLTTEGVASAASCDRFGSGLIMTGEICPNTPTDSAGLEAQDAEPEPCRQMIWMSPDGRAWAPHPSAGRLSDAGAISTSSLVGLDTIAFIGAEHEDDHSLWLVSSDQLLEVPFHNAPSLNELDVDAMASDGTTLVVSTGSGLFRASHASIIERAAAVADLNASLIAQSGPNWPAIEPLVVASEGLSAPQLVASATQASVRQAAGSQPPGSAPSPAPAPPAAPAPTATATSSPQPDSPTAVPQPPATDSDDTGLSITVTCTVTVDSVTGATTEVCE